MSTPVVSAVENESKADSTLLDPGPILTKGKRAGPEVEDVATMPVGGDLNRLAGYIGRIFDRLLSSSVHDSEPLEGPDSDYPGCWSCCCCL